MAMAVTSSSAVSNKSFDMGSNSDSSSSSSSNNKETSAFRRCLGAISVEPIMFLHAVSFLLTVL